MIRVAGVPPKQNTEALYYTGVTTGVGEIELTLINNGFFLIVADKTPFHPVDYFWKDQPGDIGVIAAGSIKLMVSNCLTWPIDKGATEVTYSDSIQINRKEESHLMLIAHVVEAIEQDGRSLQLENFNLESLLNVKANFAVNESYRSELCRAHTGAHLMALALNRHCVPFWRKDARKDSFGSNDFDSSAISMSKIDAKTSCDTYRLGKSLKKSGFQIDEFVGSISEVEHQINTTVNGWISEFGDNEVKMTGEGLLYGSRRTWSVDLEGTQVTIPCGGTHVKRLSEIGEVSVKLEYFPDDSQLISILNVK